MDIPGFEKYVTCEDIFLKPYGGAEMNLFNIAYNVLILKFRKLNSHGSPEERRIFMDQLNIGTVFILHINFNTPTVDLNRPNTGGSFFNLIRARF